MLLLLNSDYGAVRKTLKLNRFLAKVWASRYTKFLNAIFTHVIYTRTVARKSCAGGFGILKIW